MIPIEDLAEFSALRIETATMAASPEDSRTYLAYLNERLEYYKKRHDEIIEILDEVMVEADKFTALNTVKTLSENTNNTSIVLSHANKLRKWKNYSASMKTCMKVYIHLNEVLTSRIQILKRNKTQGEELINQFSSHSNDELMALRMRSEKYEKYLTRLESKYPWIKNGDIDLNHAEKEANKLNNLRKQKEMLEIELQVYHGLKPNLQAAILQVQQKKEEHQKLMRYVC